MTRFGAALARLRREAGFHTPYAFYHKNGGRRAFPFTFPYYLKIERGDSLPRPEWLPPLLALLRIPPTRELWRRFVVDYLKDLMGGEETFSALVAPLLAPAEPGRPGKQAAKRLLSEQAVHITPKQFSALVADAATYWCFECLVNDLGSHTPEELATVLELPESAARTGLEALVEQKLARRTAKGRYWSELARKFYVFPRAYEGFEKDRARLWDYEDKMARRKGAELFNGGILLRAEEGAVRRAMQGLSDAMEEASAYSVNEKGEGTALFLLQTRVRRLLQF